MNICIKIAVILIIFSCQSKENKIFWVDKNTRNTSDFLFLVESTNIQEISTDSLSIYLYSNELSETGILNSQIYSFEDLIRPVTFKNFGILNYHKDYQTLLLLRINNKSDKRDYKFIVRTFTYDWSIVDSYDFAIWNESENMFCFGSISKNLKIIKYCESSDDHEVMQIKNDGRIISIIN